MDYLQYPNVFAIDYVPYLCVLNLIINGLPSILDNAQNDTATNFNSFKPYYKWITFNTEPEEPTEDDIPERFKPYYKWITFNTIL